MKYSKAKQSGTKETKVKRSEFLPRKELYIQSLLSMLPHFGCEQYSPVADPGEGPGGGGGGGPPPYFFGNSAFSLKCRNYLLRIQHS